MKKTIFVFVLILLMGASVNAFAADEISLGFEDSQWSESSLYPEWYGGRYLDDNGTLTYVIVKGYETELADIMSDHGYAYIVRERSYNMLMRTLDEITREWMAVQTSEEVVCIQSAWLDEINNCIGVEFYTGSDKLDVTRERLLQHFDGLINTTTTDSLIELDSKLVDKVSYTWVWFTSAAMMILAGTALVWRKRTSFVYARQTVGGGIAEDASPMNNREVLSAVKAATITPDDSIFDGIMRDIAK